MKINKTQVGIILVVVILIFSLLTLLYWPFVRDTIIVPIYYFMWVGDLVLKSVPQEAYLAVLILISLIIGVNTLLSLRARRLMRSMDEVPSQNDSRYSYWRKLCSNLYSSPFAQDSFAWESRKLILSIFAHQNALQTAQVEDMIRNNVLLVPASIKKLIQEKKMQNFNMPAKPNENIIIRLRHWLLPIEDPKKQPVNGAVAEIVDYIEHLLEIDHARQ